MSDICPQNLSCRLHGRINKAGHRGKRDQSQNVVAAHSMYTEAGFSKATGKFQEGAHEHHAWRKSSGLLFQHVPGRPFSISLSRPGSPLGTPPLENFLAGPLSLPRSEDGPGAEVHSWQQPSLPKLPSALTNAVTVKLLLWPGASRGRRAVNPRWRPL